MPFHIIQKQFKWLSYSKAEPAYFESNFMVMIDLLTDHKLRRLKENMTFMCNIGQSASVQAGVLTDLNMWILQHRATQFTDYHKQ